LCRIIVKTTSYFMDQQSVNNLIDHCKHGDLVAFRRLVEAHQSFVYTLSFRLLYNEEDARDAAQETFIRVWKHLSQFDTDMKFTTWLYKIATNICYDRIKALKRRNGLISLDMDNVKILNQPSLENIESKVINDELAKLIHFFTSELTPKQKLVFTLRDLEGLEVEEIVVITGLSPGKIKSNLYCARQYIRERLEIL
jgi:RNA polymerase sigma-70 factor, ECF subfamily